MEQQTGTQVLQDPGKLLPREVIETIFLFVGDPSAILKLATICRSFHDAAAGTFVWKEMARLRYGESIAESSSCLYMGYWKTMMLDDNTRGAVPTLKQKTGEPWKTNNHKGMRYAWRCCLVQSVKWFRETNEVRFYIESRGDPSVRARSSYFPFLERIGITAGAGPPTGRMSYRPYELQVKWSIEKMLHRPVPPGKVLGTLGRVHHSRFRTLGEQATNSWRRFKGYIAFPADELHSPGIYVFYFPECKPLALFQVPDQGGIKAAFLGEGSAAAETKSTTMMQYTSPTASPFCNDTPRTERERWERFMPQHLAHLLEE